MEEEKTHTKESVMNAIEKGDVTMRSRYYFLARTLAWALGTAIVFGATIFVVSFVIFMSRGNGLHALPFLGPAGWSALFFSLPWLLLLSALLLLGILELLAKHFSFVYKRPLAYSLFGFLVVILAGGTLIGMSTLHDRAYRLSTEGKLPFAGHMYRGAIGDTDYQVIGLITNIEDDEFEFEGRDGEYYTVIITEHTRLPKRPLEASTTVIIIGEIEDGEIEAHGIRPVRRNHVPYPLKKLLKKATSSPQKGHR